jgi:hypothetical protein
VRNNESLGKEIRMINDKKPTNGNDRPAQAEPKEAKPVDLRRPEDRGQAKAAPAKGQRVAAGRGPLFRA